MIYGYACVSTAAQDEAGQVRRLKEAGCAKIFREKITGGRADRPQLAKLMKALASGDVVITPAVDHLSLGHDRPSDDGPRHAAHRGGIAHWSNRSSIPRPMSPRSSSRFSASRRSSNAAVFWSAPRAGGPMLRRTVSNLVASRS